MIRVDCREQGLLEALCAFEDGIRDKVRSESLEIGDVIIHNMVFERKTFADLCASIKDGRYKEQKARLLAHFAPKNITYILEGVSPYIDDTDVFYGIRGSAITSVIVNSMYRDGIHVYHSKNLRDTANWLALVAKKVWARPEVFTGPSADASAPTEDAAASATTHYVHHVKAKSCKIDNIDPKTCYILQLCQIPSISQKIACAITEHYGTMYALLTALCGASSDEERIAMLRRIPLVGPRKAESIVRYLFQTAT